MKLLISLLNPRYFLPIHGELRHLRAHKKLGMQLGIPEKNIFVVENGNVLEVDKHGIRVGERVPGGYVFVDGSGVGDVGKAVMRDREVLARDGFLMVVVNVDGDTGEVLGDPEIISRGFIYLRDADELIDGVKRTVHDVMLTTRQSRNGKRRERLQESLSRLLYNETKRRPMIFSVINEN
jgi:ribonuclease J